MSNFITPWDILGCVDMPGRDGNHDYGSYLSDSYFKERRRIIDDLTNTDLELDFLKIKKGKTNIKCAG